MDADGVGIDDERALAVAEAYEAVLLLQPAEQQAQENANDSAQKRDEATLEEEDTRYLAVGGAEVAQRDDVVALVDDEHGEGADDVETGYDEDEGEEDVGHELLDLHDAEGVVLLLVAVVDVEAAVGQADHAGFDGLEIAAGLEAQLQRGKTAGLVEETAREVEGGEYVLLVVLGLLDAEDDAGRVELVLDEAVGGVGHVELALAPWGVDLQRLLVGVAQGQLVGDA